MKRTAELGIEAEKNLLKAFEERRLLLVEKAKEMEKKTEMMKTMFAW